MTYDTIADHISRTFLKIIVLWSAVFIAAIVFFFMYQNYEQNHKFLQKQLTHFSEMYGEAVSNVYKISQKDMTVLRFENSKVHLWLEKYKNTYSAMVKDSEDEIDILEKIAKNFFAPRSYGETQIALLSEFKSQIELLGRMAEQEMNIPILENRLLEIFFPVSIGIFIILIVISLILAHQLQRTILRKNEIILDDIWHELQSINLKDNREIVAHKENSLILAHKYSQELCQEVKFFHNRTEEFGRNISIFSSNLANNLSAEEPIQEISKMKEKITYIQKLLSQLFTRSERASSLAKAATDNGFQAGILALNISIEAARNGEFGRIFLSASDRVKNFAEKSSNIGDSILHELKDANLSIRKAYAIGKSILEDFPIFDQNNLGDILQDKPSDTFVELSGEIVEFSRSMSIKIEELSKILDLASQNKSSEEDLSWEHSEDILKNLIVRSFERLYTLNYGMEAPDISSQVNN